MIKRTALFLFLAILSANTLAFPTAPIRNKDGSIVTGVLTASYNPLEGIFPIPNNIVFFSAGTTDLTLNTDPLVVDPTDPTDPLVALGALDGFSTTERWVTTFHDFPGANGAIDPTSVVPGQSVRVFQVTTNQFVVPTGIIRELTPDVDYTAAAITPFTVAIIPINPLPEYSSFLAVLTNDINDVNGNDATPDQTYFLTQRRTPWIDSNGNSTYPLVSNAQAQQLEPQRQITNAMEAVAAAGGVNPNDIILSWTVQTQSITPTLVELRAMAQPSPVLSAPTGMTTAVAGGFGLADIVIGVISFPYYLSAPSEPGDLAPIFNPWQAAPGAYVPPFDQLPLDPTSTNLTIANPIPVPTGIQTVPFIMTVPNATSGHSKPETGWPVVIYQHGITRNRTDMLGVADAMATAGLAVIAIDQPLHGVVPAVAPELAPFYIENTPFAPIANERTFNADYWNNETGAFGPDGIPDPSGTSSFNLLNLLVARDNLRQASADLSILALSLQNISVDGDETPDLDSFNVGTLIHSLGTTVGVPFLAVDPIPSRGYMNAATGALLRTALAGSFGDRINAALAGAGVIPGTAEYELFVTFAQTVVDSGDGINWGATAAARIPIVHNQVQGDDTVPNTVFGAPTAGSEAMNRVMGLQGYSTTQFNPDGLRGVARFLYGEHSSLFIPVFPEITIEMQSQAASFLASGGIAVQVTNPDVLVPVIPVNLVNRGSSTPSVDRPGKTRRNRTGVPGDAVLQRVIPIDLGRGGSQK